MANPKIKFKRSAVANKRPSLSNLELGELALNTYDGKLFTRQDTSGVGIATTVTLINPWNEAYGEDKISYGGTVTTGDINVEDLSGQNIFITGVTTSIGGFILRNPNENNYSLNSTPPDYSDNSGGPTMDENPISAGIYADGSASFSGIVTATNGFVGNLTGNVTGTADNANTVGGVTSSFLLDYNNFTNTPTIPTNNNELTNGAGYITSSSDITGNAATATYAVNAGFSTNAGYAHTAGISTTSDFATNSSYAHVAGIATYATTAGVATNAQGLTGTPSITVSNITASQLDVSGITTASSFSGDGSTLSGIVTQIAAGDNISIDQGTGVVTITGLANTAHVRAETLTVSGVSTFSDDANFQNVSVGGTLSLSGAGSQFFAFNEDTVKVKFANWYSSNDRQYGMGQLWFETWFAAIDNNPSQSLRDERRIGFYLEQPNNGSSDSGGTSNLHPTNDRMHIDINGVFVRDNFEVSGDANVTGISTFQSNVNIGGTLSLSGSDLTATATELNHLDGVTGITLGTANELLIVGSDGSSIESDGTLTIDPGNNYVGINQTSPQVTLHMTGEGAQTAQIRMEQYNDSADAPDVRTRRYRGTVASPAAVQAGDYLYRSNHEYWNGSALIVGGSFAFDNTNNANRTQFAVSVTTDGTSADPNTASKTQFKIDGNDSGAITFNNAYKFPTSDGTANQVLQTDGSGNLSFADVTGAGAASTSNVSSNTTISGIITASSQFYPPTLTTLERDALTVTQGALIFNTTENKVQMYLGSEWKSLAFELDTYTSIGI